jgi:hypothetical protein
MHDAPFKRNVSSQYGAPMGRRSDEITGKVTLASVPFIDGDYDEGGAYWGGGEPLWCAWNDEGALYLRAPSREIAIEMLVSRGCEADAEIRDTIIDACAWMLWAQAFVSWAEQEGPGEAPNPGAGGSWDSLVPAVPANVRDAAVKLIEAIERLNGAPIDVLYQRAADMPGKHRRKPTMERFGNCLGYQAAGAGVSWADDHPDPEYRIPHTEVYAYVNGDGVHADIEGVDERFC